ncbi:MAG: hypothetical protein WBI32_08095 [Halanaerobiales bacterium]
MNKFRLAVLFLLLMLVYTTGVFAYNVIELELDIDWIWRRRDIKWSLDSKKIAVLLEKGLFIVNKEGEIEKEFPMDISKEMLYRDNLIWLDNNRVGMTGGDNLIIINIETGEKEIFELGLSSYGFLSSLSYSDNRKEFAFAIDDAIKMFEMERNRFSTLIQIRGTAINNVFYNRNGTKLFFTVYGVQNLPFLYVFDFEEWTFDRFSEEYLEVNYIDELRNIGYFDQGGEPILGDEIKLVEMDLETLEIKDYEEKESKIIIDGYKIEPNIKKLYTSDERESIYVTLSYDLDSAFVESRDKVRMITGLSTYME